MTWLYAIGRWIKNNKAVVIIGTLILALFGESARRKRAEVKAEKATVEGKTAPRKAEIRNLENRIVEADQKAKEAQKKDAELAKESDAVLDERERIARKYRK